ncbi:MAG: hypothetical protein ABI759_00040 [Candidatus Solibacter sp.]
MRRLALFIALLAGAASPAAQWRIVGPGGGGSLYHPAISPHDSRTVLVACDMTGAYLTRDGGAHWRMINLGQAVNAFFFDPTRANILYALGDALFRSDDTGDTWRTFYPPNSFMSTGDDHASGSLQVGKQEVPPVTAFAIDPSDSRILYLARGTTLFTTFDSGVHWEPSPGLPGPARHIWVDPKSLPGDRTLYIAGGNAFYTRRDGKWRTSSLPGAIHSITGTAPIFYATTGSKVYVSTDAGAAWRECALPGTGGEVTAIAAAPGRPQTAYVSVAGLRTLTRGLWGVAKTTDAGRHWEMAYDSIHDAWLSARFGGGWAGNPLGLAVAPLNPELIYATDSGRVLRTNDGGKSWNQAYSQPAADGNWTTTGIDVTTSYGVHFDPFDPRHMFISYTDIGLWASDNGGASWHSATRNGVPNAWVNTTYWMEFDPTVRGRMWAVMSGTHDLPRPKMWQRTAPETFSGGVVRSDDGGRTWRVQSIGMPATAATHIVRDPAGALYVTGFGRGVFKSTDGGEHWTLKNAGLAAANPLAWRIVRDPKGALYLIVARRSDDASLAIPGDGALYRSTDGAEHWTRVALPKGVNGPNGLAIDPANPSRLYLAAWGRSARPNAVDGGIYLSLNSGVAWRRVLDRDQHIYDITIDPADPRTLYAAGFESKAWRSTDRGVTWKTLPGYDFKCGHRVIVHPQDRTHLYITTFGASVWESTNPVPAGISK